MAFLRPSGIFSTAFIAGLLMSGTLHAPIAVAAGRNHANPALFARAIYSCLEMADDEKDRGASCVPFLEAALDFAGNEESIRELAALLKDVNPSLPFLSPNRGYTALKVTQAKEMLEGLLKGERISLRGATYESSEMELVEHLIKVALFGEFHDLVDMQVKGDQKKMYALLLTYFSDPRAKLYDPDVRDLIKINVEPPKEQARGVTEQTLTPSVKFVAQAIKISDTEAQTISTNLPGNVKDPRSAAFLKRIEDLAEKCKKEKLPFGPVVKKENGSFTVTIEVYGVEWSWLIESYLRSFLAAAKGNKGLWMIADSMRTVHSVLSGGRVAAIEENELLAVRRRNVLKYFDSVFDGMADFSQGLFRWNPGGQEAINEITASTASELVQMNKKLLAGIRSRDPKLYETLSADADKTEFNWLGKYLGPLKNKHIQAKVASDQARAAADAASARAQSKVDEAVGLERRSNELQAISPRTPAQDAELLKLGQDIEAISHEIEGLQKTSAELANVAHTAAQTEGMANQVYLRVRKATITEAPLANTRNAVVCAVDACADAESRIARFVRRTYRELANVDPEEALALDAKLLQARKEKFAMRPQYQQRRELWKASKIALSDAESARFNALFEEYPEGIIEAAATRMTKSLRFVTPTVYGIQAAITVMFGAYHLKSGLDEMARTDDPLRKKQVFVRMQADLLTDAAYATPFMGGAAACLDVIRYTILALPIPGWKYTLTEKYPWFVEQFGGRQFIQSFTRYAANPISPREEFLLKKGDLIRRLNAVESAGPFVELQQEPGGGYWGEKNLKDLRDLTVNTDPKSPEALAKLAGARKDYEDGLRVYAAKTMILAYELSASANEQISPTEDRQYEENLLKAWARGGGYLQAMHMVLANVDKVLDPAGDHRMIAYDPFK
jgi:hypothetical protein